MLDRHLPRVRAFLALNVPAPHLVDELAHETFVFAYRRFNDFKPGTSLPAWLRAIAWNLLRAEVQRFAREQANQERFAAWQTEVALAATAENEPSAEADHLVDCLNEIPGPLRELLVLKYREDRGTDEIAARLQRSLVWVRVSLFRVRQQLRECIESKLERKLPC